MNTAPRMDRKTWTIALGAALLGLLLGGFSPAIRAAPDTGGCGHDARLDDANAHLEKAFVLIQASQNEGVVPPFGGHDVKARRAIEKARKEVGNAIRYAESSCD